MHVSEQINHVLEGEIWFFVEDKAHLCKRDFHRIPANKVHWAWNRSQSDAVVVESHSPPLVGGEIIKSAAGLFDEGETPNLRSPGENQFVPYDQEAVERKGLLRRTINMVTRITLRSLALSSCMISLASFTFAQDTQRLRYGTTNSIMNLPVWVAQDARLFAQHGLTNVEIIFIQSGTLITMGVVSGELNFSGAGAASVVAARLKGGDVALLACPVDADAVYLIARPGVKSAAELRGKTAAVTRLGSTTHFYLRSALRYAGLDPQKDVKVLQLGLDFSGALEAGQIDAAALPLNLAFPYLQKGWPVLLDLSKTDFVYPASCVVSSRSFIKENPRVVDRFLRAYVESIHLIKKDRSFTEKVFNKWLRQPDP